MTLNGKEWARNDRVNEYDGKEKLRIKNKNYYAQNRHKIVKRVQNNYQTKRKEIAEGLGGICTFCGQKEIQFLNFHHTIPMLIKGSKIYHYDANMDILCLLCVRCHVTYHKVMDDLGIDDIFKDDKDEMQNLRYRTEWR